MATLLPRVPHDPRYYACNVDCSNKKKGCDWKDFNGKLYDHLQECGFEDVDCNFCKGIFERRNIFEHQNLNPTKERRMEGCIKAKIKCIFCNEKYERQELSEHVNLKPNWDDQERGCQRTPIECKYCKKTVERQELGVHLNLASINEEQLQGCDLVQIPCFVCDKIMQRKDLRVHLNLHPTEVDWNEGCENATVHCMFCNKKFSRSILGKHININPTPQNWLKGCDAAEVNCIYCKEKLERRQLRLKAKKIEEQLDEKDYPVVVVVSLIAKRKWYEIGLELNVGEDVLNQYKYTYKLSESMDEQCFYEMIQEWLKSQQHKSWKSLLTALRSSRVSLIEEAEEVERSVICEDAMLKTTTDYIIQGIEEAIKQVNPLLKKAEELMKQYEEMTKKIENQKDIIARLKSQIGMLQRKCNDQTTREELSKPKSQLSACEEELSKLVKQVNLDKLDRANIVQSITECKAQLEEVNETLVTAKCKLKQRSSALNREYLKKMYEYGNKIAEAKKWWLRGAVVACGGILTIVLLGPVAPIAATIGIGATTIGVSTALGATGYGLFNKFECNKLNDDQKKINAQYVPLTQACAQKLDQGKKASEAAYKMLQDLQEIVTDFKKVTDQLDGCHK